MMESEFASELKYYQTSSWRHRDNDDEDEGERNLRKKNRRGLRFHLWDERELAGGPTHVRETKRIYAKAREEGIVGKVSSGTRYRGREGLISAAPYPWRGLSRNSELTRERERVRERERDAKGLSGIARRVIPLHEFLLLLVLAEHSAERWTRVGFFAVSALTYLSGSSPSPMLQADSLLTLFNSLSLVLSFASLCERIHSPSRFIGNFSAVVGILSQPLVAVRELRLASGIFTMIEKRTAIGTLPV